MYGVTNVLGPTIEFLTSPDEQGAVYCVMKGTMPPGAVVPLHSHPDFESFWLISGAVLALSEREGGFDWLSVRPGDFLHVPAGAKHAFRNTSKDPAVALITTTPGLARFLQEVGRPTEGGGQSPPAAEDMQRLAAAAAKYGHWLGSPEDNAAVGITLPSGS